MNIPPEAEKAFSIVRKRLTKSLTAVYLHGSALSGGLRPHSDVDLLAVVGRPLTPQKRKSLAADLMTISGRYPFDPDGRRPLELIVFLRADLAVPCYPARSEFVYGEWLRDAYEAGEIPGPVRDPELTLILAQARQQAIPLAGPEARSLLPVVSRSDIRRATGDLLPVLMESLQGDERNVVLTLARMWRTSATGEFVPKDAAADWAAARLPTEEAAILAAAKESYLGIREEDWQNRGHELRLTASSLRDRVLENLLLP